MVTDRVATRILSLSILVNFFVGIGREGGCSGMGSGIGDPHGNGGRCEGG